ncbi:MAG: hypothetical protein HGB26_05540 [Desulfobulbaceae bacterium]|nr:hypothetical protein [Desulfobulbaceae bacterium]
MKRLPYRLQLLIPWLVYVVSMILLVALVVFLFPSLREDSGFRGNFVSGLISTILGALIGIPIALGISNVIQAQQEELKQKQEQEHLVRILETVHNSLIYNRQQLQMVHEVLNGQKVLLHLSVDYSTWEAVQIELTSNLKNPELQRSIAYHFTRIKAIAKLHDTYFGYTRGIMSALGGGEETATAIRDYLIKTVVEVHNEVNDLIGVLERQRNNLLP